MNAALITTVSIASVAFESGVIAAARRLAIRWGFVARPNPIVRSHREPVPYLGGAALVLGYFALLVAAHRFVPLTTGVWARAGAAIGLATFGTIDDRRPFGPAIKLAVQTAIAAAYLAIVGPARPAEFALRLFVLLTLINAYNLIDVMDGLLCLLSAAALVGLLAIAPGASGLSIELLLALSVVLSMFLFNRPPARIYSGDAGSLALGFLIGAWCLEAARGGTIFRSVAIAGVVAVPLLELALIVPARLLQRRNPLRGSPDHFALRLQDQLGWSKWRVLFATLLLASAFASAPWAETRLETPALLGCAVTALLVAAGAWWYLWRIAPPRRA